MLGVEGTGHAWMWPDQWATVETATVMLGETGVVVNLGQAADSSPVGLSEGCGLP